MLYLTLPLWSPVLLLVLYSVWVQHERGGLFNVFEIVIIAMWPLDFILAHTLFALCVWSFPKDYEWTISDMLMRLIDNTDWRGNISRRLAWLLNAIAPSGRHI